MSNKKSTAKAGKKKRPLLKKFLIGVCSFLITLVVGVTCVFFYYFGGLNSVNLPPDLLGINTSNEYMGEDKVTNIALFGIDARGGGSEGRSDAIIILSINHKTSSIKLISIMRDTYVKIGDRHDKIGHAYSYGGYELAVRTLNETFNLDISEFVTVNFDQMEQVIDAVGGVEIDVTEAERYQINKNIKEIHKDGSATYLNESGEGILLNGQQAVGFSRIRAIGGDFERTDRQREVLMAIFYKALDMPASSYPKLAKTLIPMVTTSFTYAELFEFIPLLSRGNAVISQTRIPGPYDGAYDQYINGTYYLRCDMEAATAHILNYIYNDIDPALPPEDAE